MIPSPVLLLHGQPGGGDDWDDVVAALPAGTRTLAPDRPGYRSNPRPPAGLEAGARWALEQLDEAGLDRAVLVGHSYGGGVALTAAALAPERVAGLVLVASVGPGCLDGWDALLAGRVTGEISALTAWYLTPWVVRRVLARRERSLGRPLRPDEGVYQQAWAAARHDHGALWRTFLLEQRELVRGSAELDARLAHVVAPTVVLADPGDQVVPLATARALHERVAGSRLVLTDGGGHHLPRLRAADVAREVTAVASPAPAR